MQCVELDVVVGDEEELSRKLSDLDFHPSKEFHSLLRCRSVEKTRSL